MRTSLRLPASAQANPLTLALQERRNQGLPVLDLTLSNPTRAALPFPADLGQALEKALVPGNLGAYEPDPRGSQRAREAVAAWHGRDVSPEDLVLTASTSEAYGWLFKLLGDPGDQVLVPSPSYPLFDWLARLEGLEALAVPSWFHERWHLDLEALEQACGPRTRVLVAVNPNNPTGHYLGRGEWQGLLELCARRGLALVVDEVFAPYALEANPEGLPTALEGGEPPCPLFVLSGLSKLAALPQVKLGWILARGAGARALLEPLHFIADQYLSVSAHAQAAAPALLDLAPRVQAVLLERLRTNLARLDALLAPRPHLARLPVEGGWSVLLRRPALGEDGACALEILREEGVLVHPGHFFDLPGDGHLVLSLLCRPEVFSQGVERLCGRV